MHLLEPLVAGIRGAEDGSVDIYQRGTSTRATYYTGHSGSGATTPIGSITLDSNGGIVLYVNEEVNLIVKDSSGVIVREFVSGPSAAAVEVISQSFTGVDYDSGSSAVSKPTDLQSTLDLWKTNAGAVDWKVLIAGSATTLTNAFATVGAAFINVKAALYGALGDGTTNDTAAIQAALDAASTAGGGTVFFPAGTYKTTAALTVAATVSLAGSGPAASIIAMAHGVLDVLTMSAGNTYYTSITGLKIGHSQSSTGSAIMASAGRQLRVDNCWIGNPYANQSRGITYGTAGTNIYVTNSTFEIDTLSGYAVVCTAAVGAICHVWGCRVQFSGAYGGNLFVMDSGSIIGTDIDGSGMTSGTAYILSFITFATAVTKMGAFVFNSISNQTGGTLSAWSGSGLGGGVAEFGNRFGSTITRGEVEGIASKATYFGAHSLGRDRGRYYTQDDTAAVSLSTSKYGLCEVERLTTGAQTCTLANPVFGSHVGPVLQDFILVYNNLAQGSTTGTITMSGLMKGLTTFTVNANCYSLYYFKAIHVAATSRWALVGSLLNQA